MPPPEVECVQERSKSLVRLVTSACASTTSAWARGMGSSETCHITALFCQGFYSHQPQTTQSIFASASTAAGAAVGACDTTHDTMSKTCRDSHIPRVLLPLQVHHRPLPAC